jgi:hypothetical protein
MLTVCCVAMGCRLRMEIDTIPEYIAVYHAERAALRAKFTDRDRHLAELVALSQRQLRVRGSLILKQTSTARVLTDALTRGCGWGQDLEAAKEAVEALALENRKLRRLMRAREPHADTHTDADAVPAGLHGTVVAVHPPELAAGRSDEGGRGGMAGASGECVELRTRWGGGGPELARTAAVAQAVQAEQALATVTTVVSSMGPAVAARGMAFPPCPKCHGISFYV